MDNWEIGGVIAVLSLVVGVAIFAAAHDADKWQKFAAEHHCRVTQKMDGTLTVAPVIGGNGGVVLNSTPGKTAYLCDDGVTYWREN